MSSYILSLDEGTSSARAILFDLQGNIISIEREYFLLYYPESGWVEQNAEHIYNAQLKAAQNAIAAANISPAQVTTIGITNQRETVVVWDKETGRPLYNAIVWQDRRTADYCEQLKKEGLTDLIRSKTGLLPDPYFSATKIRWILQNVPEAQFLANKGKLLAGTIDTWLLWKLTNGKVHATDVSNASRTMLFNITTLQWDEELLKLFDIPASMLPEVKPSNHLFGRTEELGGNIAITGIVGDQQAATFGQGCFEPGMVKNTYGTGCFMLMNTGNKMIPSKDLITTIGWQMTGQPVTYALEGAIFSAGASIQWLEHIGLIKETNELNALAESQPIADDVFIVPAFTGLGAPQWDPYARGTIVGLTRDTGRAVLAQAALLAMAYQSDEVLQIMQKDTAINFSVLRTDGGASASNLLMQFQSNLSNIPVHRAQMQETTALGAALMAGLGIGLYASLDEMKDLNPAEIAYEPQPTFTQRDHLRRQWQRAIEHSLGWAK